MSTSLIPGVSFDNNLSSLPVAGQLLLITDHLASPADFILHRLLAIQLKPAHSVSRHPHVTLVSIASDFSHWCAIAAKSYVNLRQHLKARSLTYIDGLSLSGYPAQKSTTTGEAEEVGYVRCSPLFGNENRASLLKGLYNVVAGSLQGTSDEVASQRIVIVDDITLLEHIGVPNIAITRFVRGVYALCRRHTAGLVIRAHASPSSTADSGISLDSDLLRFLIDISHMHIEVRPLASGRSGAVSGEIAIHNLTSSEGREEARTGRIGSVQYRLNDGGAVFFQKGMGAGVL